MVQIAVLYEKEKKLVLTFFIDADKTSPCDAPRVSHHPHYLDRSPSLSLRVIIIEIEAQRSTCRAPSIVTP